MEQSVTGGGCWACVCENEHLNLSSYQVVTGTSVTVVMAAQQLLQPPVVSASQLVSPARCSRPHHPHHSLDACHSLFRMGASRAQRLNAQARALLSQGRTL